MFEGRTHGEVIGKGYGRYFVIIIKIFYVPIKKILSLSIKSNTVRFYELTCPGAAFFTHLEIHFSSIKIFNAASENWH